MFRETTESQVCRNSVMSQVCRNSDMTGIKIGEGIKPSKPATFRKPTRESFSESDRENDNTTGDKRSIARRIKKSGSMICLFVRNFGQERGARYTSL
jgi:hypothetical protein